MVAYATTNQARLLIADEQITELAALLTAWNTDYAVYVNPASHTAGSVDNINARYEAAHPVTQGLKRFLKNNPNLELTGEDYQSLYIHKDADRRARVPMPTTAPANELLTTNHLVNEVFTLNPTTGFEQVTALPEDVNKIGRAICIKAIGEPVPERSEYQEIGDITSTTYNLIFKSKDVDMKAYLITWYENPRGERGPESKPLSFTII